MSPQLLSDKPAAESREARTLTPGEMVAEGRMRDLDPEGRIPSSGPINAGVEDSAVVLENVVIENNVDTPLALPPRRARIEEIRKEPDRPLSDKPRTERSRLRPSIPRTSAEEAASKPDDGLFAKKTDGDRTPASWAEKLQQALRQQTPQARLSAQNAEKSPGGVKTDLARRYRLNRASGFPERSPVRSTEAPAVLPETTRRFLKPLVGIDPATVPVYEGPLAARVTADNRADGVAVAGNIALKSGGAVETPQQLGLLAHELTHIARQRTPRFVPPVARQRRDMPTAGPSPEHMDEEALARRVEAQVIDFARGGSEGATQSATLPGAPRESVWIRDRETADLTPDDEGIAGMWGGLPAPWEPLPDWVRELPEAATMTPSSSAAVSSPVGTDAISVQRAEEGRALNPPSPSIAATAELQKSAAPDLDGLARQVYSVLKRRLATEYRRSI